MHVTIAAESPLQDDVRMLIAELNAVLLDAHRRSSART